MKRRTKTFKIGEVAMGGNIKVVIEAGYMASIRALCDKTGELVEHRLFRWPLDFCHLELYLCEIATPYYASKIIEWMKGIK